MIVNGVNPTNNLGYLSNDKFINNITVIIIKLLLVDKEYIFKTVVALALVFRSWSGARRWGNRDLAHPDLWGFC